MQEDLRDRREDNRDDAKRSDQELEIHEDSFTVLIPGTALELRGCAPRTTTATHPSRGTSPLYEGCIKLRDRTSRFARWEHRPEHALLIERAVRKKSVGDRLNLLPPDPQVAPGTDGHERDERVDLVGVHADPRDNLHYG